MSTMSSPLGDMQTPSMGTPSAATPTSSMTPAAFDSLMGNQPETAAAPELFEGTEVPTDDASSDSDTTDPLGDDSDVTDPETVTDSTDDPETKDDSPDTSDGEPAAPVTEGDAPAEPTDEQKRTVQLPDGRQVTFPSEKLADMVRAMVASGTENPTSVYQAADQAGFTLPPVGQDIGTPVPPMDVQPGDVVKGADGNGVSIGNSEVLMENGDVKPIEDVAKVGEAGHGIFRLETADAPSTAPAPAPEQPVVPPPAPVTEQVQPTPPTPVVGEPAPAAPVPVSGDPLDLLASV